MVGILTANSWLCAEEFKTPLKVPSDDKKLLPAGKENRGGTLQEHHRLKLKELTHKNLQ